MDDDALYIFSVYLAFGLLTLTGKEIARKKGKSWLTEVGVVGS